ncbi:hypothetical protein WNZ15_12920 [Roseibium sp. AS2]|uniref:hypothetical protein n=1 Tax=Roseibium sp. AS2 TaxID=3135781 RepID=UPI0031758B3C
MRTVARFQLTTADQPEEAYSLVFDEVQRWRDEKYILEDGVWQNRKFGGQADFEEKVGGQDSWSSYAIVSKQSTGQAAIEMVAKALLFENKTYLLCEIRAIDATGNFMRPNITISAPGFLKSILSKDISWRHARGIDRVFSSAFEVDEVSYLQFERLLLADERQLPLIVVSRDFGSQLIPGLSQTMAERGAGVCHVVTIDEDVSWKMTENLGRDWSCFNGAIRVFWPRTVLSSHPKKHPLWMADRLHARIEHSRNPKIYASDLILRSVFEASCYIPSPKEFEDVEAHSLEVGYRQARQEHEDNKDYQSLAESYAREADELRRKLALLQQEKRTAEENLQALMVANSGVLVEHSADLDERDETPEFQTVKEAVEFFRKNSGASIAFPDDLADQLDSIIPTAGPPQKLYLYLLALRSLTEELQEKGSLGNTVVNWMKDKNVDCSGESETKKASGLFQFSVAGQSRDFELHLKVSNATSPDRCIRIYFTNQSTSPFVLIGCIASKKYLNL